MAKKRTLVTSALPYVNAIPHLGNMVCIVSADVYTRFLRLVGEDVISVVGTDEHGTTTEVKALEEGVTPKEICDRYSAIQKEIYEWFNCDYDCFGRSSSEENKELTIEIFNDLKGRGYIKEDTMLQAYDAKEDRFLADRYVLGECPYCKYEEARGDQCENCGKLLDPNELKNPISKVSGEPLEFKKTQHLFMDLPKIEPDLRAWMQKARGKWSQNAVSMTESWIKDGLLPRCITRDLKWGIPVPEMENKVFYSWFDAPIGYIGITRECREDWSAWWHTPEDVRLVQFMGKDNIPFHTILFPGFLIGTGKKWTLMDEISVNEFLNYEGGQFSKSRGTGVFGDAARDTGIPADVWRYYLMINRPEKSDTEFSWDDFAAKLNNELVANLGNLTYRTLSFVNRYYDSVVPAIALNEDDMHFLKEVQEHEDKVKELLNAIKLKDGLKEIMHISKLANGYFQKNEPWKVMKEDPLRAGTVLGVLVNVVKDLSILIEPFMPSVSSQIQHQLGLDDVPKWDHLGLKALDHGSTINEAKHLFHKIDDERISELRDMFGGKRTFPAHLKVAKILSVEEHPEADRLFVTKMDLGSEERTVVAGLRGRYTAEELVGKHVIVVSNLKPAELRGVVSEGMLLVAEKKKEMKVLEAPWAKPGESIMVGRYENNSQVITFEEWNKLKMNVLNGQVMFKGQVLSAAGRAVKTEMPDGSKIC